MANSSGKLQYLTLVGYKDNAFSSKIGAYRALINPDKYTQNFKIVLNEEQGIGTPMASSKYHKTPPQDLSFEFIFDGTGVLSSTRTDVVSDLNNFKKIAYDYNGEIHKPNYLKLIWGKGMRFQCQLTSLSINFTMFKSDGSPLRAKASASFKEYLNPTQVAANADDQSPDMTHERIIKVGDNLPAMVKEIYGDSSYYLKIASFNKLDNFRSLVPGSKIYFPPLV